MDAETRLSEIDKQIKILEAERYKLLTEREYIRLTSWLEHFKGYPLGLSYDWDDHAYTTGVRVEAIDEDGYLEDWFDVSVRGNTEAKEVENYIRSLGREIIDR